MKLTFLSLLLVLSLSACWKDETISGQTEANDIWLLQFLNGQPVTKRVTISFPQQGTIAGQAPCNRYRAAQISPLPWFELGPIRATKTTCDALALETTYFKALATMSLIEHRNDSLLLTNDAGGSLTFHKE